MESAPTDRNGMPPTESCLLEDRLREEHSGVHVLNRETVSRFMRWRALNADSAKFCG